MRNYQPMKDSVNKGIVLETKQHERLKKLADRQDRSVSYLIRKAIDQFLARHEKEIRRRQAAENRLR